MSFTATTDTMAQFEQQIEMMDIVFLQAIRACQKKCIGTTYRESELNKGEAVCIKRCGEKFTKSVEVVSTELASIGGNSGTGMQ